MPTLLDTCIIIDFIRAKEEATAYIQSLKGSPHISVVTVTELLTGVRNKKEQAQIQIIIDTSIVLDVTEEIATLAGHWLNQYFKSHGVGLGDGLIAATAEVHGLQVATLNLKHFPMFPELKRPY